MASYTSAQSGNWDTESTWGDGYPVAGDTVTIQDGDTVTLDSATACATLTIDNGGTLTDATNNVGLTVSGASIINGTLTGGAAALSLGSGVTATFALTMGDGATFTGGSGANTIGSVNTSTTSGNTLTLTRGTTTFDSAYATNGLTIAFDSDTTFNHSNGTVAFTRAGTQLINDTASTARTFYNIIVNNASCVVKFENGNGFALTIANDFTITAGEFDTSEETSGTSRNLTVDGVTNVSGTLTCNASTCIFGDGNSNESTLKMESGGTFNGGSGTHTIWSLRLSNCTYTCTSGTTTIAGYNGFAGNHYAMVFISETFNHNDGTIVFSHASENQELWCSLEVTHTFYNLIINKTAGTVLYGEDNGFAIIVANDLTITSGTLSTTEESSGNDWDLSVTGDTTITDTLTCNTSTITVTGGITNTGTLTPGTSTFVLDGTAQSLTGSMTFWHFTKSVAATDKLTFDNTATYTFGGNVTLTGASGNLLSLASNSTGNAFDFVMSSGAVKTSLTYLAVTDSDASSSDATQKPIQPTNSTDVSGNTDWFGDVVKGANILNNYYY